MGTLVILILFEVIRFVPYILNPCGIIAYDDHPFLSVLSIPIVSSLSFLSSCSCPYHCIIVHTHTANRPPQHLPSPHTLFYSFWTLYVLSVLYPSNHGYIWYSINPCRAVSPLPPHHVPSYVNPSRHPPRFLSYKTTTMKPGFLNRYYQKTAAATDKGENHRTKPLPQDPVPIIDREMYY
jgi:hypothetical protein